MKKLVKETNVEISVLDVCINNEEEIMDAVIDCLSDEFEYCIRNCNIDLSDEGIAHVTEIEWDVDMESLWDAYITYLEDFIEEYGDSALSDDYGKSPLGFNEFVHYYFGEIDTGVENSYDEVN